MDKSHRLSNIEVLRIVAMYMIVLSHFAFHGFWQGAEYRFNWVQNPINHVILNIFCLGGVGVDLFVMISGYFLVNSSGLKTSKIVRLMIKVIFYSVVFYSIAIIFNDAPFTIKEAINCLLPWFYSYWFVGAYMVLYILHPYINIVIKALTEKELCFLCCSLIAIWSIPYTFFGTNFYGNECTLFVMMYTIGAYLRLYGNYISVYLKKCGGIIAVVFVGILVWISIPIISELKRYDMPNLSNHTTHFLSRESIITIFISILIFALFALNIKESRYTFFNKLSATTFGVYLITDNFYLRDIMYNSIFQVKQYSENSLLGIYLILFAAVSFISASFVDYIYNFIENSIANRIINKNPTKT